MKRSTIATSSISGMAIAAMVTAAVAIGFVVARAARPRAAAAPGGGVELVMLSTRGMAPTTDVLVARVGTDGGEARVRSAGQLTHREEAGIRGALSRDGGTLFAVVDRAPGRDRSYAGTLLSMALDAIGPTAPEARALVDGVAHASRPVVTARGTVLVSRGKAGREEGDGQRRIDALALTEIDPATGAATELAAVDGWELHLATVWRDEAIVYWKRGGGTAALVAITTAAATAGRAPGARRVLVEPMSLVARDFTVDGNSLVWTDHEGPGGKYTIERLDLATGARERLLVADSAHLAPHVWPGGWVAYSRPSAADGDIGLDLIAGSGGSGGAAAARAPLGRGVDVVRALSADGRWAALWHYAPISDGMAPDVLVLETTGRARARLTPPVDTRYEIVGLREAR
jgi:hypothetical protein